MYIDAIVLSGVAVVALMIAFFGGFVYVARKDALKHSHDHKHD